ncbi:MAG: hypothetical protein ACPHF4_08980 [Rubripirellula sp.]
MNTLIIAYRCFFKSLSALLVIMLGCAGLSGCGGPSQEEMLMRAAQRRRAPDPSETAQAEEASKEPTKALEAAEAPNNTQQPSSVVGNPIPGSIASSPIPRTDPTPANSDKKPALSISTIDERQPTTALDKTERRKIAQKNIETLQLRCYSTLRIRKGFRRLSHATQTICQLSPGEYPYCPI